MQIIKIPETVKSPFIEFEILTGSINIKGRSIMENPKSFYDKILTFLDHFLSLNSTKTTVNIHLEYYNTPSSPFLFLIFRKLGLAIKNGKDVVVNWHYEEEDMEIDAEVFQAVSEVPFNLIFVKN